MKYNFFIISINLALVFLVITSSHGYSVKKVIENKLGQTTGAGLDDSDDNGYIEVKLTVPNKSKGKLKDGKNQGPIEDDISVINMNNDEATTLGSLTLIAKEDVSVSDAPPTTASNSDPSNSTGCHPDYALFGDCIRDYFPLSAEPETGAKIQETDTKVPLDDRALIKLAEDANLTISEMPSNHRYFQGRANCKCGVSSQRIVGGQLTTIREHPWMVALVRNGLWGSGRAYCGGTLINSRYVVTASHCVDGQTASGIAVVLNEQDFDNGVETAPERYTVSTITMHPQYNRRNIDNDIALLKLSRPVSLLPNGPIIPACLPASNSNTFTGVTATVTGWGATSAGGSTSSKLRKVDVPVISNDDCNTKTKYNGKITANMLCAGFINTGGKDSCQGDSGGPLTINNGGRRTLIGIVSWGYGCAQPQSPGVYNRVARYPDWILANTRDADWCEG